MYESGVNPLNASQNIISDNPAEYRYRFDRPSSVMTFSQAMNEAKQPWSESEHQARKKELLAQMKRLGL